MRCDAKLEAEGGGKERNQIIRERVVETDGSNLGYKRDHHTRQHDNDLTSITIHQ
jgi:hypothetical protein